MVCHNTKLVRILLKREPNVPLLLLQPIGNIEKLVPHNNAVKRTVKQKCCSFIYMGKQTYVMSGLDTMYDTMQLLPVMSTNNGQPILGSSICIMPWQHRVGY